MVRRFVVGGLVAGVGLFGLLPAPALSQDAAAPMTQAARAQFAFIKGNLTKTAAKIPEDLYTFKPTPEVRSVGQLVGHIADANFAICAAAAGEKPPQSGFEKAKTSKADLSQGLSDSIAYCDNVLAGLDDRKGAETVQFFGRSTPRLGVLYFNIEHCSEHYGNLVTYMRLKGIVPPSSEGRSQS